ncbi:AP-1 complex subunit mu-2 [Camellia lanceoleosa]|uniref:AP-1 complex subunit mu-2 n=1 Tax=Camellia lanceoleosa TaxID=1840588 RepID=A0ACC0IZJ9_9ERIC|nr:AP-1 complex subunit mu-2 [Camellia lanceoleosa]
MSPRASIGFSPRSLLLVPLSKPGVVSVPRSETLLSNKSFVLGEKWCRALPLFICSRCYQPKFRTSLGSTSYALEKDALIWKIKSFPGGKEYMLRAEYTLSSITSEDAAPERKAPIRVKFEIPCFTVLGIQKIQILLHLYCNTKVEWIKPNLVFQSGMINQNQTKLCVPIRWEDSYLMWLNTQI